MNDNKTKISPHKSAPNKLQQKESIQGVLSFLGNKALEE